MSERGVNMAFEGEFADGRARTPLDVLIAIFARALAEGLELIITELHGGNLPEEK